MCIQRLRNLLHYETVQIVNIKNFKLSLIHLFLQLAIIGYVIGYGLIYKKAYQSQCEVAGTAEVKVKGSAWSNGSLPWYGPNRTASFHMYDSYDLVLPPMEKQAAFITTNMWVTKNQTRSTCVWYDSTFNACPCTSGFATPSGIQTGNCINSSETDYQDHTQLWPVPKGLYCELKAWCPTEYEYPNATFHLQGVGNFTVFVRLNVAFQKYSITRDNTLGVNHTTDGVNQWTIAEMVTAAGWHMENITRSGITLGMNAVYDCNFDRDQDECVPTISFTRLDDPNSILSHGSNYRSVEFFSAISGERQLTKHYGVRLIVMISGYGAKADPVAFFTAIGAGLGLLTVATLIADFLATSIFPNRADYRAAKYKQVEISDEERIALESRRASRAASTAIGPVDGVPGVRPAAAAPKVDSDQYVNMDTQLNIGEIDDSQEAWGKAHFSKAGR